MTSPERGRSGVISGAFFGLVGIGFVMDQAGLLRFQVGLIWPMALIAIGISEMNGRASRKRAERVRSHELTTAEERVRIARELHDIVAHGVSLMNVQVAAARRVAGTQPKAAEEALRAAESAGRQSLAELRSLVTILRSADQSLEAAGADGSRGGGWGNSLAALPTLSDIEQLVAATRDAGLSVEVSVEGTAPAMSPSIELAIFRVLQESLTNSLRHGGKCRVKVGLSFSSVAAEILVEDDGEAEETRLNHSPGHGLIGMRERVQAAGGQIQFGPRSPEDGWRVKARLPVGKQ